MLVIHSDSFSEIRMPPRGIDATLQEIRNTFLLIAPLPWIEESPEKKKNVQNINGRALIKLFLEFISQAERLGKDVLTEDLDEAEDYLGQICQLDKKYDFFDDLDCCDIGHFYSKLNTIKRRLEMESLLGS